MTAAVLLLGALLAQGHGAKATASGNGGKKTARSGETQRRPAPTTSSAAPTPTTGGESGAGADRTSGSTGGSDEGGKSPSVEGGGGSGKNFKSKTYNFGAMDVEGKLKTPQLLYFLNRVKLELDMSAPDTRSFMKELEKSADDRNL
jgi:hypothetical protein